MAEYEVGKGKPPKKTQFKEGNKYGKGRPKGSRNLKTVLKQVMDLPVDMPENAIIKALKAAYPSMFNEDGTADVLTLSTLRLAAGALHSDQDVALKYIKELLDRFDGKPAQTIQRKNEDGEEVEEQFFELPNGTKIVF